MSGKSMVLIRYFTGTGNSKRIAETCAQEFVDVGYALDLSSIGED